MNGHWWHTDIYDNRTRSWRPCDVPIHAGWRGCGLCSIARNCCRSKSKRLRNANLGTGSLFPSTCALCFVFEFFLKFLALECIFDVVTSMHVRKKTCDFFFSFFFFFSCLTVCVLWEGDNLTLFIVIILTVMLYCVWLLWLTVLLYCFTVYDLAAYASKEQDGSYLSGMNVLGAYVTVWLHDFMIQEDGSWFFWLCVWLCICLGVWLRDRLFMHCGKGAVEP